MSYESCDLILLDLNLPDIDGIEILRRLRSYDNETAVLILSARSQISDKVEGLDVGASDYLVKPFYMESMHPGCSDHIKCSVLPAFLQMAVPSGSILCTVQQDITAEHASRQRYVHLLQKMCRCMRHGCRYHQNFRSFRMYTLRRMYKKLSCRCDIFHLQFRNQKKVTTPGNKRREIK